MKRVTIQDIADALNISRNTVSKAINNSGGIADATREKILKKAMEMGYKPFSYVATLTEAAAPGAAAAPAGPVEIALFTTRGFAQTQHFAVLMVDRLLRELDQLGYTLKTYLVRPGDVEARALPAAFRRENTAALICFEMFDYAYDEMLCSLGLPVLFVDGPSKQNGVSLPADQLYMENTNAVTRLTAQLLDRGVRRIGFIGDWGHCQSFYERYAAYRTAMLAANAPVEEAWLLKTNSAAVIREALAALPQLPELFVCANDFIAWDTMQALGELGKTVPDDVLVAGFDDAPMSRIMDPALTTVHIHTRIMAFTAAQLLLTRIREPELNVRTVYTETELILRDSTGQ